MKILEETRNEWKITFKERTKVTRRQRKTKYKKKDLFKRILDEVKENVEKIEEKEEPAEEFESKDSLNSEAATDPEEIENLEYYLALKEGRLIADAKILAIRILNDLIDNLPVRVETLPHVIRGGKGGEGDPEMGKDTPYPEMTKEQTPPQNPKYPSY